jgi:superfamily II DNA helicase RecQ
MAWFQDVSELVDMLFVGSHLGSGGVPRGTEAETLSSKNAEECARSLHIMHGYLTSVLRYNKTQHNTHAEKLIARFFPPRLGRLFLYYLVIIRSLEIVWADDVFGVGKSCEYKHLVFVRYAKPMQSHQFSKVLYGSSLHHIKVGLGIHDYRQFIKAVLRTVLDSNYDGGEEDGGIDVADASFGHSRDIGATYGLSYNDLPNLAGDLLRVHQKYCEHVHRWLEGTRLPERLDPLNMTQMTSMFSNMSSLVDNALERNPTQETLVSTIKDAVTEALKAGIQHIVTPTIRDAVASETSHTLSNMPWQYLIGADTRVPEDCLAPVIVQQSTLYSLRRLLHKGATPKSPEQAQILQLVLDRQFHIVGILPTGGGKSAVYQVPAFCDTSGITVSIFPFRALTQDQITQASELGIEVATWPGYRSVNDDASDPLCMPHLSINPDRTRLVCVSAHWAGHEDFIPWLQALLKAGRLNRVVVDEAHELLMGNYRTCITNLHKIQQLEVPIVCLSATLTPAAVPSLIGFFGFDPSLVRIVRANTPRPEIAYHAVQVTEEELLSVIVQEIEKFPLEKHERGLVFCNSYRDCEALNSLTGIPVYNGQLDGHDKDQRADIWRSGGVQRLICTSSFGNGINNPHVRHVVHCRDPKTMCRYVQETGRTGRDGEKARAVLFYTDIPNASNIEAPDAAGQLAMSQYLSQRNQCRRVVISSWSDGREKVQSCSSIPAAEPCDWCSTTVRFFRPSFHRSHCLC